MKKIGPTNCGPTFFSIIALWAWLFVIGSRNWKKNCTSQSLESDKITLCCMAKMLQKMINVDQVLDEFKLKNRYFSPTVIILSFFFFSWGLLCSAWINIKQILSLAKILELSHISNQLSNNFSSWLIKCKINKLSKIYCGMFWSYLICFQQEFSVNIFS